MSFLLLLLPKNALVPAKLKKTSKVFNAGRCSQQSQERDSQQSQEITSMQEGHCVLEKDTICEWLEEQRRCYDTPVIGRAPQDCDLEQKTQPGYKAISSDRTLPCGAPSGDHQPGKPDPSSSKETELAGKRKRLLKKADLFAFHSSCKRREKRRRKKDPSNTSLEKRSYLHCCCFSIIQSCPILCDHMNCSTPGSLSFMTSRICLNSCPLSQWCQLTLATTKFNLLTRKEA